MANPQIEDGYTQIANEILEALSRINLYPYESRVLLFIIRKTYGWKRKADLISLSQIVDGTGIRNGHVSRSLKSLIMRQIVTRLGNKQIGFNKDYDSWLQKLPGEVTIESDGNPVSEVTSLGETVTNLGVPTEEKKLPAEESPPTYEKLPAEELQKKEYKETYQKKIYGEFFNVKLSEQQHQKLIERFGLEKAKERIEVLSSSMAAKPHKYKYDNHYAAILNWARLDEKRAKEGIGGKVGVSNDRACIESWQKPA